MGLPFGVFLPSGKGVSQRQSDRIAESVKNKAKAGAYQQTVEEATGDVVNDYLSAVADPRNKMADFWDNFKVDDSKASKSILNNKNAQTNSNALLSLIKDEPTVINAIENHPDKDTILSLISDKLNKQNPQQRQINKDDSQEMINAIKMFAQKGDITQNETPTDLTQTAEEDDINFDVNWLDETPDESLFVPPVEEEPTVGEGAPFTEEEPSDVGAAREAILSQMKEAGAEVVTEVPMKTKKGDDVPTPTVPDKKLKGKVITLPDKVEGTNIKGWEGKKVAVLGAGPKAYKIREVGEDGKLTGPIKYVTPSQIQGETAPDVETKAPKEVKPKPKAKPKPKVATDKVTKDDIFGEPEIP